NSPNEGDGSGTVAPPQARNRDTRPGGGLGPPIDAPDPLQKYRWYILGGFAVALVIGGVFVASRQQAANRAARSSGKNMPTVEDEEDYETAEASAGREVRPSDARQGGSRPHPI